MAQAKGHAKEKEPVTSVSSVYLHVVEDVIHGVRDDFHSEGVEDSVLEMLKQMWELNMMQSGAIQRAPPPARAGNASTPVHHDLNVPYVATDEYTTPTMDLLFPPTPQVMTPAVATPLPMTPHIDVMSPNPTPALTSTGEPIIYQYMPAGPNAEPTDGGGGSSLDLDAKVGRPVPFMRPPATWMTQKLRGVDVHLDMNQTYEEADEEEEHAPITQDFFTLGPNKRKREDIVANPNSSANYIPQRDGAADPDDESVGHDGGCVREALVANYRCLKPLGKDTVDADDRIAAMVASLIRGEASSSRIPQRDGMGDEYDDVAEEDYNDTGEEEPQAALEVKVVPEEPAADSDHGEPPLNEDDDDDLGDNDQDDEEPQTEHLVLAQFEKVSRSKSKWKCILKDGIMHLNDKDTLFVKATGEFEF